MRRCHKGVDHGSDESPKLISIDEQPNHEIVHALRLGEAQRTADESLDPGPQIDMLALDFLHVLLPHLMLLGVEMPLVGPPAIRGKLRDAQGLPQLLASQEALSLPSSKPIRSDLPRVMIHGVPQPTRWRLLRAVRPPLVELCGQPTPSIQCLGAAHLPGNGLGVPSLSYGMVDLVEVRCLFWSSAMTVLVLTCKIRAVSRIPRACIAISTICSCTAGACPR
jgi:hypothetical protein